MSENRSRLRLLVLAGGPFEPYEQLLDELGIRDIVIVRQNMAVVEEYLEAADAGLYTSEYESFGLGILETVFHGKPVVAFRVGGIPEVLGDSYPLYPFGDVTAAASALDALVQDPKFGPRTRRTDWRSRARKVLSRSGCSSIRSVVSPYSCRLKGATVKPRYCRSETRRTFVLRLYHHRCPNVSGVIKLTCFPIRHSNASVRCGLPWQVALVQSVARRELEKIRHRGAYEVGMRWFGVTPAIDIGFHDSARTINIVTIDAGAMIFVFAR